MLREMRILTVFLASTTLLARQVEGGVASSPSNARIHDPQAIARNISLVSYISHTNSAGSIAVQNRYAFTSDGPSLRVYDLFDITNPQEVPSAVDTMYFYHLQVSGTYLYVAAYDRGLHIFNIDDPTSVSEIGHCDTPDVALDLALSQSVQGRRYAYIAALGEGMRIIDISDAFHPAEISSIRVAGSALGVAVSKPTPNSRTYAYISAAGLYIIDVTDPLVPKEMSETFLLGGLSDVAVQGNYAYVAQVPYLDSARQQHNGGLRIIDASNPSEPISIGFLEIPGYPWQLVVAGDYVYLAEGDSGVRVIDVRNPRNPIEVGYYIGGSATDLTVTDDYLFVANTLFGNNNPSKGILILRFSAAQLYLPFVAAKDKLNTVLPYYQVIWRS